MLVQDELTQLINEWVAKHRQSQADVAADPDHDGDLLANGALDSMGFVELLVHIESVVGKKVDLTDLDPSEFTSVSGLSRTLLNSWNRTV